MCKNKKENGKIISIKLVGNGKEIVIDPNENIKNIPTTFTYKIKKD